MDHSPQPSSTIQESTIKTVPPNSATAACVHQNDTNHGQNTSKESENQNWTTVKYRRKKPKNALKGSKQVSGLFTGVQDSKDLYVGRCSPKAKEENIIKYIQDEFDVNVINCKTISNAESSVKAFKVTLKSDECEKLLDASRWPENVRVRKYFSKFNERKPNNQ